MPVWGSIDRSTFSDSLNLLITLEDAPNREADSPERVLKGDVHSIQNYSCLHSEIFLGCFDAIFIFARGCVGNLQLEVAIFSHHICAIDVSEHLSSHPVSNEAVVASVGGLSSQHEGLIRLEVVELVPVHSVDIWQKHVRDEVVHAQRQISLAFLVAKPCDCLPCTCRDLLQPTAD